MTTIQIVLPETLEGFVAAQAVAEGHHNAGDYILSLIRQAQQSRARNELEARLLEGVEALDRGEGRPMIPEDWDRLRARARAGRGDSP